MTPTIHIVTPCLNMRASIDRTILSVITQAGPFLIRYHVKDGGSTDGTAERLDWWAREIAADRFPLQCEGLEFSWSSEPDIGMYDAIIQGYAQMAPGPNDWLTWINADDILMPGALAFCANVDRQFRPNQVSWFGGAACIANNSHPMEGYDRVIPVQAIREGLCDGIHWDFVQQEGTFYRKWLWDSAKPAQTIRHMKVGGDWNLWRLFGREATLVQWRIPLGCFSITPGQLSAKHRETYEREMDAEVARAERQHVLKALGETGYVIRRRFRNRYPDGLLTIIDEVHTQPLKDRVRKVFGTDLPHPRQKPAEKILHVGDLTNTAPVLPDFNSVVHQSGNLIAHDHGWQFPAVTEQHAFHRVRDSVRIPAGVTYVAYPWATLIDKLQTRARDAGLHLRRFREFCKLLPTDTVKVTVCQQIYMRRYMELFAQAGIDHIFWSHATPQDATDAAAGTVRPAVHPFPLYPVQIAQALPVAAPEADDRPRPHLFSFVGARANQYYPRQTRNVILDLLQDDPRGFIAGRADWFYERVVYDHQVNRKAADTPPEALIEQDQAAQFRAVLEQSIFSLCPAGTGPNSIRLWESLGAGSIPVILADDWAPPGNPALWEAACIFRPETEAAVKALPDELEAIARDPEQIAAKRQAMRQLWLLYGPDGFVHDIHVLLQNLTAEATQTGSVAAGQDKLEDARALLTRMAGSILIGSVDIKKLGVLNDPLTKQVVSAQRTLRPDDQVRRHFETILTLHGVKTSSTNMLSAPMIQHGSVPKVCLFGRHSNRTPISYEPFVHEIPGALEFVDAPETADLVVSGFNRDFTEAADTLLRLKKAKPQTKFLILSEEPLWDVHWSGGFTEKQRNLNNGVSYQFLNHENSQIFDFDRFPYFVLTEKTFPATYALRIKAMAQLRPAELLSRWEIASLPAAFFAEHRTGQTYDRAFPEQDIWGLCAYRTAIAERVRDNLSGTVCVGKGWREQVRRQELPNWHLDKLAALTGRTRICSALENTHQYRYISEKLFDPFAVGAIPIYYASHKHRAFEFVPEAAMLNLFDLNANEAARRISDFQPDIAFAEAWLDTAERLATLFTDVGALQSERKRFARSTLDVIHELLANYEN